MKNSLYAFIVGATSFSVLLVVACSPTGSPGTDAGPGGHVPGTMGAPCGANDTCSAGLTCVGPALVGGSSERYCAPTCSSTADCQAFAQTSYEIGVPDTYTPFFAGQAYPTAWGTKTLSRGVVCGAGPNGGSVCQFGCANFMALWSDGSSCSCLPGYSLSADGTTCQFGTTHQCSIFSYGTDAQRQTLMEQYGIQTQSAACSACNSSTSAVDQLGCHSNFFACDIKTNALNGDCAEYLPDAQFQQCVAQKTNFDCSCDSSCEQSCAYYGLCNCCTCTQTSSAPPGATCDGGAPSDAGADSGACVDFTTMPPLQQVLAADGAAPPQTGGALSDGLYQVTSAKVFGTGKTSGSPVATYAGFLRITGSSFETEYSGSTVASFQGAGTFTVSGGTVNLTFTCSNPTTATIALGYTVTSATTIDFATVVGGYTSVATYTKQ